MRCRETLKAVLVTAWVCGALLGADEPRKTRIGRDEVLRAVKAARKGDRQELSRLLRSFRKLSHVKLSKEVRPDLEKLLAEADTELQLLSA